MCDLLSADSGSRHGAEDPFLWEGDQEPPWTQPLERLPAHPTRDRGLNERLRQVRSPLRAESKSFVLFFQVQRKKFPTQLKGSLILVSLIKSIKQTVRVFGSVRLSSRCFQHWLPWRLIKLKQPLKKMLLSLILIYIMWTYTNITPVYHV